MSGNGMAFNPGCANAAVVVFCRPWANAFAKRFANLPHWRGPRELRMRGGASPGVSLLLLRSKAGLAALDAPPASASFPAAAFVVGCRAFASLPSHTPGAALLLLGNVQRQPRTNLSQARDPRCPRFSGGSKSWSSLMTSATCHAYMSQTPSQSNGLPGLMRCRCSSRRHAFMEVYFVSPPNLIMPVIAARVRPPALGLFGVSITQSNSPLYDLSGYLRASSVLRPLYICSHQRCWMFIPRKQLTQPLRTTPARHTACFLGGPFPSELSANAASLEAIARQGNAVVFGKGAGCVARLTLEQELAAHQLDGYGCLLGRLRWLSTRLDGGALRHIMVVGFGLIRAARRLGPQGAHPILGWTRLGPQGAHPMLGWRRRVLILF